MEIIRRIEGLKKKDSYPKWFKEETCDPPEPDNWRRLGEVLIRLFR